MWIELQLSHDLEVSKACRLSNAVMTWVAQVDSCIGVVSNCVAAQLLLPDICSFNACGPLCMVDRILGWHGMDSHTTTTTGRAATS